MTLAKRTLQHPGARPLAWFLLVAVVAGTSSLVATPAGAQEQEARSAVVLDFVSDASGGALLGRSAGAAMALQLTERKYVVRSRAEVIDAVTRLGVKAPYEPDEIRSLAAEVDARQVITGRVLSVEEKAGPPAVAKVILRVEVYDGATGDLVNGAVVEGVEEGTGAGREDRDPLRDTAVERAIARALTQVEARVLLSAAILQWRPTTNEVVLNRGSRNGVTRGMMFDIYRVVTDPANAAVNKQVKVGRVRVVRVSADDSDGVVENADQGVSNTDMLRQVFVLPEVVIGASGDSRIASAADAPKRGGKGLGGILGGLLGTIGGVGLLALLLSMNENTNRDSPTVDPANGAYLQQATPGQNPAVVVRWGDRDWSPPPNFIGGYFIYRGQSENFAANESEAVGVVAGASQRVFSDDPTWNHLQTTIPIRFSYQSGEDIEEVEEDLDVQIVHQSVQPGQTYYYKVRRIGPPTIITPPTLIGSSRDATSRSAAARRQWMQARAHGRVLTSGGNIRVTALNRRVTRSRRQVTAITPGPNYDTTLTPEDDNDLGLSSDIGLSDASSAVGPITYLVPPELRAPSDNNQAQTVDNIAFEYQGVLGATEYVLQIATNINFAPVVFQSANLQTTASSVLSFAYNSSQAGFVPLAANTTYFWRVGTRSRFRNQPLPQPDGYVFSSVYTFTTADQPPAAP